MPTLNWIGKEAVVNHHQQVPFHLLKDVPELACGDPGSGNLIVQGDNLVALKALLPYYAGKIKCIYIDPPYNTGNEGWAYNDNVRSPIIREWLGKVIGKEGETLDRHDRWLCMMYPRLVLLRQFLQKDGVIFVSIDDNELANLLYLLEEIFYSQNHLATIVWEKGKKGDSKFFSENHEYIVVFARDRSLLVERNTKWKKRKAGVDKVLAHYQTLRDQLAGDHKKIREEMMKWYRSLPKDSSAKEHKHYNGSDERGLYFAADFSGPDDGRENRPRYDIFHPETGKPCKKPSTGWRWDEETTKLALSDDPPRIHFGPDEQTIPCRKTYLTEASQEPFPTVFYKDGRAATLAVEQFLGKGRFAFPKDADVLADLIGMVTAPGDAVLDSFAGSGTTGQAILQLNAEGGLPRRFVLIQMPYESNEQANHQDIPAGESAEFLRKVVRGLMAKYSIADIDIMALDRFRLRDEIEARIQQHRDSERKSTFQSFLLPESALTVSDDLAINFKNMSYEPSWLYGGGFQFKKHYFGAKPGELKEKTSDGKLTEEFKCAQFLDGQAGVKFWVRNLSRKSSAFRLQTSKDWFYPDFLAQLRDGRVLAVEYKGEHLWSDAEEKRAIGKVWESRSNGKCLFVMPTGGDFSELGSLCG